MYIIHIYRLLLLFGVVNKQYLHQYIIYLICIIVSFLYNTAAGRLRRDSTDRRPTTTTVRDRPRASRQEATHWMVLSHWC